MENKEYYKQLVGKLPVLKQEIGKVIVGQEEVIDEILIALLAGGHCLLEGVPGLAKTLMVKTLADGLDASFKRIQFTPDLMPGDIIGTEMLEEEEGHRYFKFNEGPIFANLILADEINRTPPKTQAALLEAMQEKKVTFSGKTHSLPTPFFIIATQNPIEQAGTYPLPEAQLDRFLLYIKLNYPQENEELDILKSTTGTSNPEVKGVLTGKEIEDLQNLTRQVHIDDDLIIKINKIVRATRPESSDSEQVKQWCDWGSGPRGGQALVLCSKARALLKGRFSVIPEDIETLAFPVLRHRIALNFRAEAEQITTDEIIKSLL